MAENLWPDFDLDAQSRTVRRILIETGMGIEEKSHGAIRFEVESQPRAEGGLVHNCFLVAQGLGYRYPFMRVEHGFDEYPVTIFTDAYRSGTQATDEEKLTAILRQIFNDDTTKKVVLQLLDVVSGSTTRRSWSEYQAL